ncbi:MAG: CHAT domain-containing protein, partial [Acidimicrobiales bacterium]
PASAHSVTRLDDALRATVGGGRRPGDATRLDVRVLHASLENASFPVAVGHYAGLPPEGSERFLDSRLGGALRARQRVGQYPDQAGSAVFVAVPPGHRPPGGLVLGLGTYGGLTAAILTEAMAQAVIVLALDERERSIDRDAAVSLGVSSVLVGMPGRYGLPLETSLLSLVEGVVEAVRRLAGLDPPLQLHRVDLELVELYEQRAEQAAVLVTRLGELLDPAILREVELKPATRLTTGGGAQSNAPTPNGSGTPWVRVLASLDAAADADPGADAGAGNSLRRMHFSRLGRGAQSNIIEHDIDIAKVRAYVGEAVRQGEANSTVGRTLYELLFPLRAKLDFDRSESLQLLVDEDMAEIPWELMSAVVQGREAAPLALRAGMLRQLHSSRQTRERAEIPAGRVALFVGDPPTGFPRLPGAGEEAEHLVALFGERGWDVVSRLYKPEDRADPRVWMEIVDALNARPYRVVHIAAHGFFDEAEPRRSGVVIGPEPHQRLTALEFANMTVTPELVFLNCCHLGRMDSLGTATAVGTRRGFEQPHRLAATVAQQLLRNGVRAVVVAGWAVDDVAAFAFASRLYGSLLDGHPFGEAVRRARVCARDADDGLTNTWGAYQCYGDPDFQLVADEPVTGPRRAAIVSAVQFARELDMAAAHAARAETPEHRQEAAELVAGLRVAGGELVHDDRVLQALARAFAELGMYDEAVATYGQALRHTDGDAALRSVEQLAACKVQLATNLARSGHDDAARAAALFGEAAASLDQLQELAGRTAERHGLRGTLETRRATVLAGAERAAALGRARDEFRVAWQITSTGPGGSEASYTNRWLQLRVLAGDGLSDDDASCLADLHDQFQVTFGASTAGYVQMAAAADTWVTAVVAGLTLGGRPATFDEIRFGYQAAFAASSTLGQRESVIDHLDDISRLVPDERAGDWRRLHDDLAG